LGGEIHTNSKVSRVVKQNGGLQVQFSTGGEGGAVDADQVLLAVGRVPFTQGLDADKAGVKLDRGRVVVDEHLHTDADGIWAIGDVIGGIMLAHVASYEGVCAVENGVTLEQHDLTIHARPTLPESLMEAALAAQGRAIHIANRRSDTTRAARGPTSLQGGEANMQNREKDMAATIKPSTPPSMP